MKITKPKRIMSLFLAALMCVTSLVGIGTTAYAAEETDDVYLISFPRDGEDVYKRQVPGIHRLLRYDGSDRRNVPYSSAQGMRHGYSSLSG